MTNKAIGMFNLVAETFVTLHIDFFIAFVDGAQCIYDISGNNLCIIGRTPNVWFHTQKMLMLIGRGGEGKSPVGRPGPVTPWGKPAMGYKTRKKKNATDKFIVKRRNAK